MFSTTPASTQAGLLRHRRGARSDLLRERLRCRHDDRLRARQQLPERDGDVAGSGRHVDEQHVEVAPVDVLQKLLERAMQHRAAPHHRLVVVEEEPDRHQLQIVRDGRDDHLVDHHRLLADAEHVRDRVAVDVRVEDARPRVRARRGPPRCSPSASTCRPRPCPKRRRSPVSSREAGCRAPRRRRAAWWSSAARSSGVITSNVERRPT